MQYSLLGTSHYDAQVKLNGETIECLSPKRLKRTYPQGGCKVVGEISGRIKDGIGILPIGETHFTVTAPGTHHGLFWREAGYLQTGRDEYIVLLKSRVPFLLLLLGLLAIIGLLGILLLGGDVIGPGPDASQSPSIVIPDHPLPPIESDAERLEGDDSQKANVENGGGSVTMSYSLDAFVKLSSGDITVSYQNPNSSTHNISLDLYVISDGKEYLVAQSGLVKAGYGLTHMTMLEDAPLLMAGHYEGLFRLHCYDPISGEKAIVVPQISGVKISVTE